MKQFDTKELYALELKTAMLLRYGVLLAGGLLLAGWILQLQMAFTNGTLSLNPLEAFSQYRQLSLADSLRQTLGSDAGWSLIVSYLGMIVLISLPILRVCLTAYLFVRRKEYLLAVVAGAVVLALAASLMLGFEI